MGVFNTWWFWLLILAIVGFIIAFTSYETLSNSWEPDFNPDASTPFWIWIVFGISMLLFIISAALYWWGAIAEYKQHLLDVACGKVKPQEEVLVCPPDPCNPGAPQKQMVMHSGPTFTEKVPAYHCNQSHVSYDSTSKQSSQPQSPQNQAVIMIQNESEAAAPATGLPPHYPRTVAIPLSALNPIY
jgi:hypothetical protein